MNYWLIKSEPGSYSLSDLRRDGTTEWDGVRNYQARNFLRDSIKQGDAVLFYHSGTPQPAVVGTAHVVSKPHPDSSAFNPADSHFDPASRRENPTWITVDIGHGGTFTNPVTLETLKVTPGLEEMVVIRKGSRLSVQPVTGAQFDIVCGLGTAAANL